jgi:hypothetical protein
MLVILHGILKQPPLVHSALLLPPCVLPTDGQVCLFRLVRLHTDNFCLFLHKQTDKRQTSV